MSKQQGDCIGNNIRRKVIIVLERLLFIKMYKTSRQRVNLLNHRNKNATSMSTKYLLKEKHNKTVVPGYMQYHSNLSVNIANADPVFIGGYSPLGMILLSSPILAQKFHACHVQYLQ